jgi:outer membrane protein assembly factor BamA
MHFILNLCCTNISIRAFVRFIGICFALHISITISIHPAIHTECEKNLKNLAQTVLINTLDLESAFSTIDSMLPSCAIIDHISYESDILLNTEEINHLIGLQEKKKLVCNDLKKALYYLSKKNIFESVIFTIYPSPKEQCYRIHLFLKSRWIISSLSINSFFLNKESFRQYYTMQVGDPFDMAKHNDACNSIEQELFNKGYCSGQVTHKIIKDKNTKSVSVLLQLQPGKMYIVDTAHLKLSAPYEHQTKKIAQKIQTKFLDTLVNKPYNTSSILEQTKLIHRFLTCKGFLQPAIMLQKHIINSEQSVTLIFSISLPQRNYFSFSGNAYFSSQKLRIFLLEQGSFASLLPAPILEQEIQKLYHSKGFWNVSISTKETPQSILFNINEGQRASLKNIELRGVNYFNSSEIISTYFSCLTKKSYIDDKMVQLALDQLTSLYQQHGFWHINILKKEFIPSKENSCAYTLRITVDEQSQTYLGEMRIVHGAQKEPIDNLKELLLIQEKNIQANSIPFTLTFVQKQKEILKKYLEKNGYNSNLLRTEYTRDKNLISINWHIEKSIKSKIFGKTIIQTVPHKNVQYIQRELAYKEHDPWNASALEKTLKNIKELDLFEHISIEPDYQNIDESELPIIVKAYQGNPLEFRFRAGCALKQLNKNFTFSGFTYTVGGTIIYKNPLKIGDRIRINIDMSSPCRVAQIQYYIPWFFKWPIRTMFEGYAHKYMQPGITNNLKNIYIVTQKGLLINTNHTINQFQIGNVAGVELMNTKICNNHEQAIDEDLIAKAINFCPQLLDQDIAYGTIEPSLFINHLNDPINPTHGSFSLISLKAMLPLHGVGIRAYLLKIMAEQSVFIPLLSCTLGLRGRIGHIFHKEFSTIGPTERFYLGGSRSVRSYETDMVPPLGEVTDKNNKRTFLPQGGKSMFNINIELRLPYYKGISGVIFQDLGALSTSPLSDIQAKEIVFGSGFGVRYNTPIGPIRFDIAIKWHKPDPSIMRYAWFLTIGHPF